MKFMKSTTSLAVMAAMLTAGAAYAQDPPAQDQSSDGSLFSQRGGIETVISSAQKKQESVQDVPIPVTAFSGVAIERKFAVNLEDLNKLAPSVQLQHVGLFHGASSFTVRGIGTSGIESFDDPHVAIFIDGVYQPRNAWALSNLLDIETVEMLRGPQGTIYGRNAYSGAITLTTKKPDVTEYSGKASLQYGNPGRLVVGLIGNVPIVEDKFAMRLATQFFKDSGFFKNDGVIVDGVENGQTLTHIDEDLKGTRIQGNKYVYFRPSFRLTPNDALDITLTTEFIRQRGDGTTSLNPSYDPRTPANSLCDGTTGTPTAYNCNTSLMEVLYPGLTKNYFGDAEQGIPKDKSNDPYEVGYSLPYNNSELNSYTATLNVDYTTDFGTFSFLANYQHQRDLINTDTDGTSVDFFSSTRFQSYETYQFETHFVSDFSETVDMIAGLFYLFDSYHLGQILWTPFTGKHTYDNPLLNYYQNGQDRKTWAAYTQFEVHFTDELSVVAGVRYSWEKKFNIFETPNTPLATTGIPPGSDFSRFPLGNAPQCSPLGTTGTIASPCIAYWTNDEGDTWDNFAPRVGVNWKAADDFMLFAYWQRAYKSGGFVNNASAYTTFVDSPYGEELIDNFEIGFKSEWFDSRLQLNANLYYQKLKGLQRQVIRPADNASGQETFISNNADARSYGLELEVIAVPVDGLTINSNLAYNNIKYTNYCADLDGPEPSASPANGRALCGQGATQLPNGTWIAFTDFSDLKLGFAPKLIANLGWTYDFPIGNMGNISIGQSFSYTSKMATAGVFLPRSDRRSMLLVDAQISWESPDSMYRVSVWGKNLTNEIERLSVTPVSNLFSFEQGTTPRTYGITLTADF
ncbi:TonB-dependent receptor [Emcibacter sp. SYSU 3D8]|uniref:TonB-dependent receptor n=1 Tax=Emcibacter sp. SYSU 3D8 TaxID=3133969 RepID=UPI0031FF1831